MVHPSLNLQDVQEKNQSELLNTLAAGQIDVVKKAKKSVNYLSAHLSCGVYYFWSYLIMHWYLYLNRQKLLTAAEAREKSDEIMQDLRSYKEGLERDNAKQEQALHVKLSDLKKKQMEAKVSVSARGCLLFCCENINVYCYVRVHL